MAFSIPTPYASKGTRRHYMTGSRLYSEFREDKNNASSSELFCSKCTKSGLIVEAHGFCKMCLDFLCTKCCEKHESSLMTLNHGLVVGSEMLLRYRHAMRKGKKKSESRKFPDRVSRMSEMRDGRNSYLDMIANDRADLYYTNESKSLKSADTGAAINADFIKEPQVKLSTDTRSCFICSCTVLFDNKVILADANNRNLKLYDKYFNCISVFNMKKEPWDTCVSPNQNSEFYVTESQVRGVHHFKVGYSIEYIFTIKVDGECYGVTGWKVGIAVSVKSGRQFEIRLLDYFGNILRNIKDDLQNKLKLSAPWYLSSLKQGQKIVVSDAVTGSVSCIDTDGGVDFIFKNRRELHDPRNIATDHKDNIYVVDYESDTVHQISAGGKHLGVILCGKDGLDCPCGLECHGGRLFLQKKMDSNRMQVYDLV